MGTSTFNKFFFTLIFIFIMFMIVFASSASFVPPSSASLEEADALLQWKTSLQDPHSQLTSWTSLHSSNTTSPCAWFAISCNNAMSIIKINLTNSGLQGTLHEFPFSLFPNLEHFDLRMNSIFGSIPSQISQFSKLVHLDLSSNHFNGSIPASLGNLTNLIRINLSKNSLSNSIPSEIGNLSNLVELYLNTNNLSGDIPSTFVNLKRLKNLYMYENMLIGSIPLDIGNLESLKKLSLYSNHLSGPIPESVCDLTNLTLLAFHRNNLSGPVPEKIGNLKSLVILDLWENKLTGPIPMSIGNLSKLQVLYIRDNRLSGSIPEVIGDLRNLVVFRVATNNFTGHLPQNLCKNGLLKFFTASGNSLTGRIPQSLRNCRTLYRVRLDGNQLTGNISEDLGVYPNLKYINLSDNKFYGEISEKWGESLQLTDFEIAGNKITGSIPAQLGNLTQLHWLNLSSNRLVGTIPVELGKLTSLVKLILHDNQLSGPIPQELGSLVALEFLDLSKNNLSHSIPSSLRNFAHLHHMNLSNNMLSHGSPYELGNLRQLSVLDLSHNSLEEEIPIDFCGLGSLVTLNLSHNNFSGVIPSAFDELRGLEVVDMSYNQLWGPIPNNKAFLEAPIEAFEGNKGLCGNATGLLPCNISPSGKRPNSKTGFKIVCILMMPLVGAIIIVSCRFYVTLLRKKCHERKEQCDMLPKEFELRTISIFDGKLFYEEIIKATGNFDDAYCIGRGGAGSVYKAKLPSDDMVAVKKLHSPCDGDQRSFQKEFLNEVRALTEIRHRNIVKLYGFCAHLRHSLLVYEYLEKGSLFSILANDEEAKKLEWSKRLNIIKGVAHGLAYMHTGLSPPIVHRDISSKNILLDGEDEACISDFGTAKILELGLSNWTAVAGTFRYVAPEFAYTLKVTDKCDVYSFGVLVLEVIKGRLQPLGSLMSQEIREGNIPGELLDDRLRFSRDNKVVDGVLTVLKIAVACLNANPKYRPTMHDVSQLIAIQLSGTGERQIDC